LSNESRVLPSARRGAADIEKDRSRRPDDAVSCIPPAALYVHVPLCASKCSYCDFYSIPTSCLPEGFEAELVQATLTRARVLADRFSAAGFDTVYIGGGTPTQLSPGGLDALLGGLETLASGVGRPRPKEWTVEANPDSLREETLDIMLAHGVTRLSIGIQSLDAGDLSLLGRRHSPEAALTAVRRAAKAGLSPSVDLIASIPKARDAPPWRRDPGILARSARDLLDAGARHLSVYDLTVEEGTPLAAKGRDLRFPDEDEAWEERQELEACLREAGLRRYEVSNYAAPGLECRHNLAYWRMNSYLGTGPGAVSTIRLLSGASLRIEEVKSIDSYADNTAKKATEYRVGIKDAMVETVMMAFRTSFGLDLKAFALRFGREARDLIGESLDKWGNRIIEGERWPGAETSSGPALDGEGLNLLNRFMGDCLEEIERSLVGK
jgi:oxygen-independent coproporphyrinogen-3 oxidase